MGFLFLLFFVWRIVVGFDDIDVGVVVDMVVGGLGWGCWGLVKVVVVDVVFIKEWRKLLVW